MPHAEYHIHIPTHDNLGNELRDEVSGRALHDITHEHLYRNAGFEGSTITGPHIGNWRDYPSEGMMRLETMQEDTPENDSHVKQTAQHIAELANQEAIYAIKRGQAGPEPWMIWNPNYQPGVPAPYTQAGHPDHPAPYDVQQGDYQDV
jgi:hypothetical protein